MGLKFLCVFGIFGILIPFVQLTSVQFPSGQRLTRVANESTVDNPGLYTDPLDTETSLFDSEETSRTSTWRLGLNIPVSKFKSPSARYFRAHPTFIKCAEQTILLLKRMDIMVEIKRGYITSAESTNSENDQYLQTGCAVEFGIHGSQGDVQDIAAAALKVCPAIIERELRDLGVTIMSDRVLLRMLRPGSSGPSFKQEGTSVIPDMTSWTAEMINLGLEPKSNDTCENYSGLKSGEHYPPTLTQDRVVGTLDVRITRDMERDFKRLVQYQGTSIEFDNSEGTSAWCGLQNLTCVTDCNSGIQGNGIDNRCADRVMTTRLLAVLNRLQKKARLALNDKLKVIEAWDEPHSGADDGDNPSDPLHFEGRAAKVKLVSGDSSKLEELAKFAICFGGDYVEHRGDYLYISVKRMQVGGKKVNFPNMELMAVDVPTTVEANYRLPVGYSDAEARQYPVFDSSGRLDATLAKGVTIRQFTSPDYRYFRLHPLILSCYVDVVWHENKWRKAEEPEIEIEVVRGFMSNNENNRKFDVIKDKRFNTHNFGLAMQVRYKPDPALTTNHTAYKLLYSVIDKCAPRFREIDRQMGVGLYRDSVFVDIRRRFHLMEESLENLPEGVSPLTFEDEIEDRYLLARDQRVIDPDNFDTACLFQTAPQPQSQSFTHQHSEVVKRKRRRRSTDDTACIPTRATEFCASTEKHRQAEVAEILSMLDRKHYLVRTREEIKAALEGCLGDCGTCLEGDIWDSKTEHCNNFIHWVDWGFMNTQPDITNFFVRSNRAANIHACEMGEDCVENAPLFSLLAPSIERVYRPDPEKSVEEELYSIANNPSPLFRLIDDIYGILAQGIVKIWVKDDTEMTALTRQLEVAMMYNPNVTKVEIYVDRYTIAKDAVRGIVEKAASTMVTQGCPAVTRATLAPYEILEVPQEKRKRAAEPLSLRHQVRDYHKNYEARWAAKNMYL